MYIAPTCVEPLLPGPAARPPGLAYAESVWWGMLEIERETLALRGALQDIDIASGLALDILGDWVSERRFGLVDVDYRRVIKARRVAVAGGTTPPTLVRGWRSVTGDPNATLDEVPGEIYLTANVKYVVDTAWLARAAGVIRDTIPNGRGLYAAIGEPGVFVWDVGDFDVNILGHDFS